MEASLGVQFPELPWKHSSVSVFLLVVFPPCCFFACYTTKCHFCGLVISSLLPPIFNDECTDCDIAITALGEENFREAAVRKKLLLEDLFPGVWSLETIFIQMSTLCLFHYLPFLLFAKPVLDVLLVGISFPGLSNAWIWCWVPFSLIVLFIMGHGNHRNTNKIEQ